MDTVIFKLFNMSISASWLIAAVIVLRLFLKRVPKWTTCLLWAIVAVRLIVPFSFESVFSLIPSAETVSPSAILYPAESAAPVIHSGVLAIDETLNPIIQDSIVPEPGDSADPFQIWVFVGGIVWAVGVIVLLCYALFGYVRIRIRVREGVLLRENIWLCDAVNSPFILGIARPRIYLFSGTEEEQMDHILSHERAHLKRRDHWWKPLGYLLLAVYWFNPLVWAAYILFCRDIEIACDERAIKNLNLDQKKAYSVALVSCSLQNKKMLVCPLAFGEMGVKERVKTVLRYKKPTFWTNAAGVAACLIVAVCFLTNPSYHVEAESLLPTGTDLDGNQLETYLDEDHWKPNLVENHTKVPPNGNMAPNYYENSCYKCGGGSIASTVVRSATEDIVDGGAEEADVLRVRYDRVRYYCADCNINWEENKFAGMARSSTYKE